ncbi:D-alanyl-D-alanine carboxypeptidase [Oceanisphaera sp. DM8]|uniref:D-alanyl-D-alanine carboxypeptidase n=2 Tax=Oceanisphaera pacifica TaxID=2818389 RepID=A0ABS3NIL8_9GAMM|nr:D-alanyl-D-alanine carboxypeptidase [Oceanisphaera pacifica]
MALLCVGIGQVNADTQQEGEGEDNPKYAAIIVNANSGEVLHADRADEPRYPASLTKMMTLYLLFDAMDNGLMKLDTRMPVSAHAASMPQTNISLAEGDRLRVRDAIPALIVRSANDAAVVVAEALGGTEREFANIMTAKAKALNMTATTFRNASGLPDNEQRSTARDLAILAMRLMKGHADYYHYFSTLTFTFNGKTYDSHNRMVKDYAGTDGMKTGYIRASGFNVATSVLRDGQRLVGVVMGGKSSRSRNAEMTALLDKSFVQAEQLAQLSPNGANKTVAAPVSNIVISTQTVRKVTRKAPDTKVNTRSPAVVEVAAQPPVAPKPLPAAASVQSSSQSTGSALGWAIQVGSFQGSKQAKTRAANAQRQLDNIKPSQIKVSEVSLSDRILYRSQLVDLQQEQAKQSCARLERQGMDCLVIKMPNS